MSIRLAVDKPFRTCGRVLAARDFCEWLDTYAAADLGLPSRPVTVELVSKAQLSRNQVGRFVVEGWRRRFVDDFWVTAALGRRSDAHWEAQLASIPHELAHVGQWVRLFGERTPWEVVAPDITSGVVGLPSLAPWRSLDFEGGGPNSPEGIARRLTPAFLEQAGSPAIFPQCAADCPCRG